MRRSGLVLNENSKIIIEHIKSFLFVLLLVGLGFIPSIAHAGRLDLELAHRLIVEGKSAEAYALLEPYEFEQAGNTQFDYLLGLAAVNSGQADKASIILERVLEVDPLHVAARIDLGRAYYMLGDFERAHAELTRAQALNPPPPAQATIILYLSKIEHSDSKPATQISGYFEGGTGYNTNVNNSTSQNQVTVPILLNAQIALDSTNVETADGYLGLAAGGQVFHPISSNWSLFAGVDMRSRNNFKYHNFDILSMDGSMGASYEQSAEQFKGGLLEGQLNLGGAVNRKSDGLNVEWKHTYNAENQSLLFSQYIRYQYPDPTLDSNNFNQAITGFGWTHFFADGLATVSGSLYGGNEYDTNFRVDGGKSIQGVRLAGQLSLRGNLDMFASGGLQWGKYDQTNSSFLVIRDDFLTDFTIGVTYRYTSNLILRPQISLVQNHSNIIIDQYNQADVSLTLRREFK